MASATSSVDTTVTSQRLQVTVGPSGRLLDVVFTALHGVSADQLTNEFTQALRVARGQEPVPASMTVTQSASNSGGLLDATIDVEIPTLPLAPTAEQWEEYSRQFAAAAARQWELGMARGQAILREGEASTELLSLRATGAGVVIEATFNSGVSQAHPDALRAAVLDALQIAIGDARHQ